MEQVADTTVVPDVPAARPTRPGTPRAPSGPPVGEGRQGTRPVGRRRRTPWKARLLFLLFAGPNVALLVIFTYKPLLQSLYYSTLQWNIGSPVAMPVGLQNYADWFTDPTTPGIVGVTLVFTLATVGGGMVTGLALALVLNRKLRGTGAARTVVVAPYVLSGVAVGLLWLFVFDPNFGVTAALLRLVGLASPDWYNDPQWALVMVIVVYLWKNVGYVALIYLAALQSVPKDLVEAAAIDGASSLRSFGSIVLPLLGPTTFFLTITTLLTSLQSFDIIQAMTKGGPLGGTTTMMYQIYQEGFQSGRAGYSSAVATILFVVLLLVTFAQLKYVDRKVHY
jgi:sn-glycerol 3-phosphate transport system permease protein